MSFRTWFADLQVARTFDRLQREWRRSPRRRRASSFCLAAEVLEVRSLLSSYYAATASDLVADIKAANLQGGANTIALTAPTTSPYVMSRFDNNTNGWNMLPVIANGDNLTILTNNGSASPGFGDSISGAGGGRLFDVATGASLAIENVTLQDCGSSTFIYYVVNGGAIYNQGTLVLSHVLVERNTVNGPAAVEGGAIWSNGSLTVENACQFLSNSALSDYTSNYGELGSASGGTIYIAGGTANIMGSTFGGSFGNYGFFAQNTANAPKAYGGAVYVAGGTVAMSGDTIGPSAFGGWTNQATYQPAWGNPSGLWISEGGGLYVAGGTVTLTNDTITHNFADYGAGIFISSGTKVYLDSFTKANTFYNGSNPRTGIWGPYTVLAQSSFTANANPIAAGSSLTLTATNLAPATPGTTITQVSFFYFDSHGAKRVLGTGKQTSPGVWTLTVKANLTRGAYTLWAEAKDSDGLFGSASALTLTVQ
jgi:hypothetical protein